VVFRAVSMKSGIFWDNNKFIFSGFLKKDGLLFPSYYPLLRDFMSKKMFLRICINYTNFPLNIALLRHMK
jgi:hypothetical protein